MADGELLLIDKTSEVKELKIGGCGYAELEVMERSICKLPRCRRKFLTPYVEDVKGLVEGGTLGLEVTTEKITPGVDSITQVFTSVASFRLCNLFWCALSDEFSSSLSTFRS